MAAITWRNINAPDMSQANAMISEGFGDLSSPMAGIQGFAKRKLEIEKARDDKLKLGFLQDRLSEVGSATNMGQLSNPNLMQGNLSEDGLGAVMSAIGNQRGALRNQTNDALINAGRITDNALGNKQLSWMDRVRQDALDNSASARAARAAGTNLDQSKFAFAKNKAAAELAAAKIKGGTGGASGVLGMSMEDMYTKGKAAGDTDTQLMLRMGDTYGKDATMMFKRALDSSKKTGKGGFGKGGKSDGKFAWSGIKKNFEDQTAVAVTAAEGMLKEGAQVDIDGIRVAVTPEMVRTGKRSLNKLLSTMEKSIFHDNDKSPQELEEHLKDTWKDAGLKGNSITGKVDNAKLLNQLRKGAKKSAPKKLKPNWAKVAG